MSLSPLARLLYIGIWCEADKEGRLAWKPLTFKLRYLPGDDCDAKSLCAEIVERGLVVLYGDGYAYIPAFSRHQHINPRESDSVLPAPDAQPRDTAPPAPITDAKARVPHASARVPHAQGGREGKGKERNGGECASGGAGASTGQAPPGLADASPPPPLPDDFLTQGQVLRPDLDLQAVWLLFCEHQPQSKRGLERWKKWVKGEQVKAPSTGAGGGAAAPSAADPDSRAAVEALALSLGLGRWDDLVESWQAYKNRVREAERGVTCG